MDISYLSQLLHNYVPITEGAGDYNVQLKINDPNVQICVVANPPTSLKQISVFSEISPDLQSLPNNVTLPADGGFWFFTVLVPYVTSGQDGGSDTKIIFGMGAGEKGPGMPNEVIEFTLTATDNLGLTNLSSLGAFLPANRYWSSFTVPVSDAMPQLTKGKSNISVKASSFNLNTTVFEAGAVVLLLKGGNIVYVWDANHNPETEVILPLLTSTDYQFIALVKGAPDTDGFIKFSVGDPEKDGKAKVVKV